MLRETSTSYASRQVDIEALKHVEKMLRIQRVNPDIQTSPRIVAGIEKAVQRYAKLFLTHIGSVKLAPSVGSELLSAIRNGQVANIATLNYLYSTANVHALQAIRADDNDAAFGEIPDDERIVSTQLMDLDLDFATRTVRIHVLLTTAAGEDFKFIIPVGSGIQ